jgi:hypothetical protein
MKEKKVDDSEKKCFCCDEYTRSYIVMRTTTRKKTIPLCDSCIDKMHPYSVVLNNLLTNALD